MSAKTLIKMLEDKEYFPSLRVDRDVITLRGIWQIDLINPDESIFLEDANEKIERCKREVCAYLDRLMEDLNSQCEVRP